MGWVPGARGKVEMEELSARNDELPKNMPQYNILLSG
jgi:hypothetical protein